MAKFYYLIKLCYTYIKYLKTMGKVFSDIHTYNINLYEMCVYCDIDCLLYIDYILKIIRIYYIYLLCNYTQYNGYYIKCLIYYR